MKLTPGILMLALFISTFSGLGYAQSKPKTKDSTQKAGSTNQTTYSPNDVISTSPKAIPQQLTSLSDISWKPCPDVDSTDEQQVKSTFDTFIKTQSNGECLLNLVQNYTVQQPTDVFANRDVIIIHAATWDSSAEYKPTGAAWAFYRVDHLRRLREDYDLSGTPFLYNASHIYLVDLHFFDNGFDPSLATLNYQFTTTGRQKQNQSDVATLASALLKVSPGTTGGYKALIALPVAPPSFEVWGVVTPILATSPIPYDLAIAITVKAASGREDALGCNPSPCSFSKTVTHYDPEYWDVSLGVSIPGMLEPKYTSTGALTNPTRHIDAYAFLDIYPFQHLAEAPSSLTSIPHFNLGVPISSQSLHRPYVGLAENLGFLTKQIKLNIPLSLFAGPVFMKQQVYVPSFSGLRWDHAIKMMYGVELPISAITKYMKGGSGSSNSGKSGSSNGSGS
jgi:hypothetical protein